MSDETLLSFPCEFPIKIMGSNSNEFREAVIRTAQTHTKTLQESQVVERPSRNGKYLAFTVTMTFESRETLDDMYRKFTALDGVAMVL